ncbi:hypothetical protein E3N88_39518 [Mikania micrantha]|uniref:DC1 domain-containing protein n=1 Tax=Mikania micrantha TaxID=192012 RepID=A0A5N6LXF2_9ASTR|nr:hypothetical protein E3N88_39518 [Mikania micrantha]
MDEHEHPLTLIDLWSEQLQHEEEDEEDEEDGLIAKQDFRCLCCRCKEEITLFDRYYVHLGCATSREEPFMSILTSPGKLIRNYEEANYPNLLHLPFPDPSYSLLKHLFFEENISITTIVGTKTHNISHQHPLILDCSTDHDITRSIASSSRIMKTISFHDPMKRIQLLCDGCVRPITTKPIYMCANEDCNFVLHEWCTRLPVELKSHHSHPQHTRSILHSKCPDKFFGVFRCDICWLPCNGFVYHCEECGYKIDVNCAFIPEEITHASHPNHLLSRVHLKTYDCRICGGYIWDENFTHSCKNCDNFYLHPWCALLIPERTRHKCDKHPMKLSYFPIENHKSEYFCEICEEELNPQLAFYHCYECMQSMHPACASSILCYETHTGDLKRRGAIYKFANVKFGGTYNNTRIHPHPLSFVQGIATDGCCTNCHDTLQYEMIFKCLDCEFAICYDCLKRIV